MNIRRMPARIARMSDLSPSAREVTLTLPEPLGFTPGAFVNVFLTESGQKMRRAYSISSDEARQGEITLSIRKGSAGGMSERFWDSNIGTAAIEIMGPLGLNTADKIQRPRVFLFAFGIGVSVVKGILHHLLNRTDITEVTVVTGSRNEEEILYRDFFEEMRRKDSRLSVRYVLSRPKDSSYPWQGYIQDHVGTFDFTSASVYLCGAKAACAAVKDAIEARGSHPQFLIEAFD